MLPTSHKGAWNIIGRLFLFHILGILKAVSFVEISRTEKMASKVLVVDDEPDVESLFRQFFRSQIKKGELTFVFAENGSDALDKLRVYPDIDVVFTDINMPVMDGLTFLEKKKENNHLQKTVVISAYGDMQNIRTAMNRGAFDFITKPITFEDLQLTLVKSIEEMELLKKGIEAQKSLIQSQHEKEIALIEKAEAQQQAMQSLQEKEKLILFQNELLESQVAERTKEVLYQKELLEIKNKEIMDSIHYANSLQKAILPPENELRTLFPQSFIFFKPKDIISGDFYWFNSKADKIIVVAADCTGHGVAGALMSVLGTSLLNQIVNEKGITVPDQILKKLNNSVINSLNKSEADAHAGMDVAICSMDLKSMKLEFSGAKRPILILRKGELLQYTGDKFSIGSQYWDNESFTHHSISILTDDSIYLFSDGFVDQFGGENGKKIMTSNFKELLISIQNNKMREQGILLNEYFESWKGKNEQVDDVMVIGIKI